MFTGEVAGLGVVPFLRIYAERVSDLAVSLPHPAFLTAAVSEMRDVNLGKGDADEVAALFSDELTVGDELAQLFFNPSPDDLLETVVVLFDLENHKSSIEVPKCRSIKVGRVHAAFDS